MSGKWTRESTKCLIALFKQKPILYNINDISYYNGMKREEALLYIESKLKKLGKNFSVKDIRKKIKTVRAQFNNEQNLLKAKNSTDSGIGNGYTPRLWCYDRLKFLEEYTKCKENNTNTDDEILDESDAGSETIGDGFDDDEKPTDFESSKAFAMHSGINKYKNMGGTRTHPEHTRKFVDYISGEMTKIIDIEILEDAQFAIISILRDAIKKDRQKKLCELNPLWEGQSNFDCQYAESIPSTKTVSSNSSSLKLVDEIVPPAVPTKSNIVKESPFSNPHGTIILKNIMPPASTSNISQSHSKKTTYNNTILSD